MISTDALVDAVAEAIFASTRVDGEGWDDLSQDEKDQFSDVAQCAVQRMTSWFSENEIVLIPLGTIKVPSCTQEAQAMMAAGMAYLKANPPKLVTPPKLVIARQ